MQDKGCGMSVKLPRSFKRHARRFVVIILQTHRTAKSQVEINEIFEAYFEELITAFEDLGETSDKALELVLASCSKMLDMMLKDMPVKNEPGYRE